MANRKLPPDSILAALIASGDLYAHIARTFHVGESAVRLHARRLGFDPIPPGQRQGKKTVYRGKPLHTAVDVQDQRYQ